MKLSTNASWLHRFWACQRQLQFERILLYYIIQIKENEHHLLTDKNQIDWLLLQFAYWKLMKFVCVCVSVSCKSEWFSCAYWSDVRFVCASVKISLTHSLPFFGWKMNVRLFYAVKNSSATPFYRCKNHSKWHRNWYAEKKKRRRNKNGSYFCLFIGWKCLNLWAPFVSLNKLPQKMRACNFFFFSVWLK